MASSGSSYAMETSSVGSCSRSIRYDTSAGSVSAWNPCAHPDGTYNVVWSSPVRSKYSWFRYVGDVGRRSTTTSNTAPNEQRTSLASPLPDLTCMPRITPFTDREILSCTKVSGSRPAPRTISRSNVRQKKPRSSTCAVALNMSAPVIAGTSMTSIEPPITCSDLQRGVLSWLVRVKQCC